MPGILVRHGRGRRPGAGLRTRGSQRGHNPAPMGGDALDTVVIPCGGRGTPLQEHTRTIPKALVELGGHPTLWHGESGYSVLWTQTVVPTVGYPGDRNVRT